MRKLLILALLAVSSIAHAQLQKVKLGGLGQALEVGNTLIIDSSCSLPKDTLASAPIPSLAVKGDIVYLKRSDGHWYAVSGGGGSSNLQGTVNQVNVDTTGGVAKFSLASTVHLLGGLDLGSTSALQWGDGATGGTIMGALKATASGSFLFTNPAGTGLTILALGGTTNTTPGLGISGTSLTVRLGDNSGYASLIGANISANGDISIPTLGRIHFDGLADTTWSMYRAAPAPSDTFLTGQSLLTSIPNTATTGWGLKIAGVTTLALRGDGHVIYYGNSWQMPNIPQSSDTNYYKPLGYGPIGIARMTNWPVTPGGGGGGSPNTSVGGKFAVAINGTNNVKSIDTAWGSKLDSTSTPNVVKVGADSNTVGSRAYTNKIRDSLSAVKVSIGTIYGLHIVPIAQRGINPIWGHDSILVPITLVDSGAFHWFLNGDSTITGYAYVPPTPIKNELKVSLTNNNHFDGTSISAGFPGTTPQSFPVQVADTMGYTSIVNYAVSNSTIDDIIYRNFNNEAATDVFNSYVVEAGPNNYREDTSAVKHNAIKEGLNTVIANHFLDSIWAISNSSITKGGTWTPISSSNFVSKSAAKSLGTPESASVAGATLTFVVYDNSLVIGTYGYKNTSAYGSVSIQIDGKQKINPLTNTTVWSGSNRASNFTSQIGTYDPRQPIAWVFTGLGIGAHTVVITLLQNLETDFDYIGKLELPGSTLSSMIVTHTTKATVAGYLSYSAPAGGSDAGIDSINRNIDTLVNMWRQRGYPIATARLNEYLNNSMYYTDGLHLLPNGYIALANAILSCINRNTGTGGGLARSDTANLTQPGTESVNDKTILSNKLTFGSNSTSGGDSTVYAHLDSIFHKNIGTTGTGIHDSVTKTAIFHSLDSTVAIFTPIANISTQNYAYNKTLYSTDKGKEGPWLCDVNDHTTASDGILCIVDGLGRRWKRPLIGNIVEATWGGVVGDGITNCTFPLKSLWPLVQGKALHLPSGPIKVDSIPLPALTNVEVYGQGDTTRFIDVATDMMINPLGDQNTVYWHDFRLDCEDSVAAVDFGNGLYYSIGIHTDNILMQRVSMTMPHANATAVNMLVQTGTAKGSTRRVYMDHVTINGVGQSGWSFLNRDSVGKSQLLAGTLPIEQTGYDSLKEIYLTNSSVLNLGRAGSFGIGATWDGFGYHIVVRNVIHDNCLGEGEENTGMWYATFQDNHFKNTGNKNYGSFGFGPNPIWYNTLINNVDEDSMNVSSGFTGLAHSQLSFNVFKTKSDGTRFTNSSYNTSTSDTYIANGTHTLSIISNPNNISTGNRFFHPTLDASKSNVNNSIVLFDGKGVSQNSIIDGLFAPITTGKNAALGDTAANTNYIFNPNFGSAVSNSNFTMSLTGRASTVILTNDSDLVDYKDYQFTGTTPQPDTVILSSRIHTNFLVRNGTNNSLFITMPFLGGNGITVPSSSSLNIFTDSVSIRTSATGFGTTVANGNTITLALNSGSTIAFPMAGASAGAITAAEDATLDSLMNRTSFTQFKYVPTFGTNTNIASITADSAIVTKEDKTVTVYGSVSLTPTTGTTVTTINLVTPFTATWNGHNCWGNFSTGLSGFGVAGGGNLNPNIGNNGQVSLIFQSALSPTTISINYTYRYTIQ